MFYKEWKYWHCKCTLEGESSCFIGENWLHFIRGSSKWMFVVRYFSGLCWYFYFSIEFPMPSLITVHGLTSFKWFISSLFLRSYRKKILNYIYEMLSSHCTFYICNWYLNNLFLLFFSYRHVRSCTIWIAIPSCKMHIAFAGEELQYVL